MSQTLIIRGNITQSRCYNLLGKKVVFLKIDLKQIEIKIKMKLTQMLLLLLDLLLLLLELLLLLLLYGTYYVTIGGCFVTPYSVSKRKLT